MNKHKSLKECIEMYEKIGFDPNSYETSINSIITFARQDDVLVDLEQREFILMTIID